MKSLTRMLAGLLPVLILAGASAFASDLYGTVAAGINQTPIIEARVVLRGPGGLQRTATTDSAGEYRFTDLDKTLQYSVDVTANGFKSFTQGNVRISSDAQKFDILLELETVLESVVVKGTGEVLTLISNSPDVSQIITPAEVLALPTASRNVTKYALLNPHVRQTQGLNTDGNQGNRLSINAQSYRHTAFILDGLINYDWTYANGPYQLVSSSAIEDVKVITNQYAAEYGTSTSGIVKVNTKAGTNELSGEAFAFVIPSGLQANAPVATFHIPSQRLQWGALLGGTLVKNKTFYFVSYEGVDQDRGSFIQSPNPGFFIGEGDDVYALTRFDHNLTDNHALALRLNFYHYKNTNANDRIGGFNQPSYGRMERSQSWGLQGTDRLVIGKDMVNFLRINYVVFSPDNNTATTPSVGINRPSYSVEGFSQNNWDRTKVVDISDMVALNHGRHNLKFGVEAVRVKVRDYLTNLYGTYRFDAGPPKPGQKPRDYSQTFGIADLRFGDTTFQTFVQDDFRISSRFSGNLGLRYEYQSTTDSLHRLAPRLGFAWDVTGSGKTRVTAGAGIFYDTVPLIVVRRFLRSSAHAPLATYTIPYGVPGFPVFPNSLSAPPTGASAGRLDLVVRPSELLNPYGFQSSVGVERELGGRVVLMATGIYAHTLQQPRDYDINHPAPFIRTAAGQIRSATKADATRPYTTYDGVPVRDIVSISNTSSSVYRALDVGVRRQFATRVRTEAHYVWAAQYGYGAMDDWKPNDWDDLQAAERAPSNFYQRHRVVGNAVVDLPYNFRFGGIVTVASGLPVNPLTGVDNNGDTYKFDRPVGLKRNSFRGPRQANVDVSLGKQFTIAERFHIETRAEFFNIFNHNNYTTLDEVYGNGATPVDTFLEPVAGITNVDPSRRIQFGVRLLFGRRSAAF